MSTPSGYRKINTQTAGQSQLQNLLEQVAIQNQQQGAAGINQYTAGGAGANPIINQANQNFQRQTIPSILNAFGSENKGSSALNNSLAQAGSDLNSQIASLLAGMGLDASKSLASIGTDQSRQALGTQPFSYQQKQPSTIQQLLLSLLGVGGQIGGAYAGAPRNNFNFGKNV